MNEIIVKQRVSVVPSNFAETTIFLVEAFQLTNLTYEMEGVLDCYVGVYYALGHLDSCKSFDMLNHMISV